MFNASNYTKWYFDLVESRKNMTRECFTEKHHIIPKSLGGTNASSNIVRLTPKEHYICHLILTKMVDSHNEKKKMAYALLAMRRSNTQEKRVNARQYDKIRNITREYFSGENNPFYGKGHFGKDNPMSKPENYKKFLSVVRSEEHRKMMSEKMCGEKNGFYGKEHTRETKEIIAKHRRQPIDVLFEDGNTKTFNEYRDFGRFLNKSRELASKLCQGKHNHLLSKYGIKEIMKCQK